MTRTKGLFPLLTSPLMAVIVLLALTAPAYAASGITVSTSQINFEANASDPLQTRTVQVTSPTPGEQFYVDFNTGGTWLRFAPDEGTTPATITIGADPSVGPGTYIGSVRFTALSDNQIRIVSVVLNVAGGTGGGGGGGGDGDGGGDGGGGGGGVVGTVTASPSSLTFQYTTGNPAPAAKTFTVNNTGATKTFTASAGSSWLAVTPTSGTAPATLSATADPAGLTPGTYQSTITITSQNSTITVPVTLIVVTAGGSGTLTATPSSLSFSQTIGGELPAARSLTVDKLGGATSFTASSNAAWLTVAPANGTTPAELSVSVNPSGMAAGVYEGIITLNAGTSAISVPVTLTVTSLTGDTFTVTPSSLTFTQKVGATGSEPQTLAIRTSTGGIPYTVTWTGGWVRALPPTGLTPGDVDVTVNASLLTPGTYEASVIVTSGSIKVTVPVKLTVTQSSSTVTASPTSLSFSYSTTGPNPVPQKVHLDNLDSSKAFTATATSTQNWLSVTPAAGNTPSDIMVTAKPSGMAVGTYQGTITITTGSTSLTVSVTLTITKITLSSSVQPAVLGFTTSVGAVTPPPQNVAVISSGAPFTFAAKTATANQGNWLIVTPDAGTTPASLTVSVTTTGLPAGQYTGTITIAPTDPSISSSTINVSLTIGAGSQSGPTPIVGTILNSASLKTGNIAPGEIIIIKGTNLGPAVGIGPEIISAGAVMSSLAGTRVLFDGIRAPLMYVQSDQITTIVPYEMYGRFATTLQVEVSGSKSSPLQVFIDNTVPAVFTVDNSGSGQASVTNQDGSTNGILHPADRNSVITIWGTGEGQTTPSGQDGRIIATDLRVPLVPVAVSIGGVPVTVKYAGSAAGVVSGYFQVNVLLGPDVPVGSNVPLEIQVGSVKSQPGVTIAVK